MPAFPPFPLRSCLVLLVCPTLVWAADADKAAVELPTVNVSATQLSEVPTTTRIDAQTLDDRMIRSYEDLGRRAEPGVSFNRSNQSINIRGLEGDRVQTRVDGIRMPFLQDNIRSVSGGLDSIDFRSLSDIQVQRGANSSQLGSGALGGAVQLRTLSPEDLLGSGDGFGTQIKTDYDSADRSTGASGALAGRQNNTAFLVQMGGRWGHEMETMGEDNLLGSQRTRANPADTRTVNGLGKLQQQIGEHRVGLTVEQFTSHRDIDARTGRTATYPDIYNTEQSNERQRVSVEHQYTAASKDAWIDSAESVLYWQKSVREDEVRAIRAGTLAGPFGRNMEIKQDGYGLNSSIAKRLGNHSLSGGIELGWTTAEQYTAGYDACPSVLVNPGPRPTPPTPAWAAAYGLYMSCSSLHKNLPDMPKTPGTSQAFWLRDDIRLSDSLKLSPGLRYDHYEYKPENTPGYAHANNATIVADNSGSNWSGSLLLNWQAYEWLGLYAQWAQGFKAPDANELYATMTNYGVGYAQIGNPDLKPEQSTGYEVGAKLGNQRLGGSVSLFDNHYKDFIDSIAATAEDYGLNSSDFPFGFDNVGNRDRVHIYGAEATAHWQFATSWTLWSALAWAEGKDRETNVHLNTVAPMNGRLGLSYAQAQYGADLIVSGARKHHHVENEDDFKAPGYGVVDLTGYWKPAALQGLELRAGLFNLFDRKYWNALTEHKATAISSKQAPEYYTEPGRSFRVAANWVF